ncbi:MAG: flagellar export chaperone FliS [Thermodesulfobacteriota bacterium]
MAVPNGYATYLNTHFEGMDPKKLILMLYDGALKNIRFTREAIQKGNIPKRGESLSKVIAIVTELNASLDSRYQDEPIRFLRGLYTAILTELPKVSITNDISILDRTEAYIEELKTIWTDTVMKTRAPDQSTPAVFEETGQTDHQSRPQAGGSRMNPYRNPMAACYGQRSVSA